MCINIARMLMPILCPKQYRHNWAGSYLLEKAQTGAIDE